MASRSARSPCWAKLSDEELLDVRLANLWLRVEGSVLEERVARLCDELDRAGIRFRLGETLDTGWWSADINRRAAWRGTGQRVDRCARGLGGPRSGLQIAAHRGVGEPRWGRPPT